MSEAAQVSAAIPPLASAGEIVLIPLDLIDDPFLPQRSKFADQPFADLVESIAHNGIQVPLRVRPVGDRFQVIAGHRRKTAALAAGLRVVPCIIDPCTELEALGKMIAENSGREEPSDAEQGRHYFEICQRFSLSEADVARMYGKTEAYVTVRCDMIRRFPELAEANENGEIIWGVALQLARVNEFTFAKELRGDPAAVSDEDRERIRKHRAFLLDLCKQQGATVRLATSYVEQWKRTLLPMNAYDPNAGVPASAPPMAAPVNKCACCGESSDANAMVVLYVHSWEKAALRAVLREKGMFGYE